MVWTYALLSYLCGGLPFAVWVGRWALGQDVRAVGDRNPGAFNVLRLGGARWFVLAMLLDFLKGALPVGLAHLVFRIQGAGLVLIALAPIMGHATGPFLGFRGGKALAVTFGAWAGLSLGTVPLMLGLSMGVWMLVLKSDGWAVMAGQLCLLPAIGRVNPDPVWLAVWAGSTLIFLWKHWHLLKRPPRFRFRVTRSG